MPDPSWSTKRAGQYGHIKDGLTGHGVDEDTAQEIAARTVNKVRARDGVSATESPESLVDISSGRRGGLRGHRGAGARTKAQLYGEA